MPRSSPLGRPVVWLDEEARRRIHAEAARRRFVETGGPLFGFESGDQEVVVVAALGPGPRAKHRPRSLIPDREATQAAIRLVHQRAEGRYRYIGSWHSHPLGSATPSRRDVQTAREVAAQLEVDLPRPLILIQATRPRIRLVTVGELGGYHWDPMTEQMSVVALALVYEQERTYPVLHLGDT